MVEHEVMNDGIRLCRRKIYRMSLIIGFSNSNVLRKGRIARCSGYYAPLQILSLNFLSLWWYDSRW